MLSALILLQLLIPPSLQFFFGSGGGGGGGCGCPCPVPPPIPICAPQPICAQPAPCSTQSSYPSYSPSYSSYSSAPAPLPSPFYQPGWSPAIPSYASAPALPSYSTSYSAAPPPLVIPSAPSYVASVSSPSYSLTPSISIPGPLPPSPLYMPAPAPLPLSAPIVTNGYDQISIVTSIATTPSYLQSGYVPAASKLYDKQYDDDNSIEGMAPPPPPPPIDIPKEPSTYDYRTSEVVTPTNHYKPAFVPSTSYMEDLTEGQLVEKQGYWMKGQPVSQASSKYGQFETRHNILKRMKTETIPRTNNTCNSIKLANVMMRAIVDDVSVSKRMIQHATKLAFDGAKFDVFCAIGEFSYSIHSRKYCEVTKEEVTCFAFR
ncbi:CBN-GRL-2 protein [Caenorhabditis brenneri]|uniref:CBN-GRL-2 protein n=1 Tax=Caenorhabditis brenneri TaxID=135651 RepID=G0N967_CAEBE|nr:CBN-GRL-2 protein [Caenorhabditis brenneri]